MSKSNQSQKNKRIIKQASRIEELKKLLTYYKEITETVREPFIILDNNLCVMTANQAFYRKFKVLKKDTEGRRIYELGNNQWDSKELRELLERILPMKRVMTNYKVTHDFPKIGKKVMLLNARQVDSKQLILVAMEDITSESKLKADSTEMTENLLIQRNRLRRLVKSKDEFISLASHQLRTPATIVKQYLGMLREGYVGKLSKEQKTVLTTAYQSNERQLEIINDLLRVAKVDAGKVYLEKSACDVVEQLELVIKEQAILFKSREQRVVLNKPKKQIVAFIDNKLMLMVLENLLENAGKYSQRGAKVTIDIEQSKTFTTISIKDKGVGIRKNDRHKLFKKFSRIDNPLSESVSGTGLGLYWAKTILDLHEGSIEVTSRLNVGSTFVVKTPIVKDKVSKKVLAEAG